jgi:hypothetical protein
VFADNPGRVTTTYSETDWLLAASSLRGPGLR